MMEKMAKRYADFPDDTLITARQENHESIHRHNAFAEKVTTLGELKEELDIQ
jgi:GTP cyclohydrolase-4